MSDNTNDQTGRARRSRRSRRAWHEARLTRQPDATPDLLENTSLGPPYLPPQGPSPRELITARRRQQAEGRIRIATMHEAEMRAAFQAERRRFRDLSHRADLASDALSAHRTATQPLERELAFRLFRFTLESVNDAEKLTVLDAFSQHLQAAKSVSFHTARQFAIISWFNIGLPQYLRDTIEKLTDAHEETVRLRYILHDRELSLQDSTTEHPDACAYDAICRMLDEMYIIQPERPRFGFESESDIFNGFADYSFVINSKGELRHLRVSFMARKTRLLHAEPESRFGFRALSDDSWQRSLDGLMDAFITAAKQALDAAATRRAIRSNAAVASRRLDEYDGMEDVMLSMESINLDWEMTAFQSALLQRKRQLQDLSPQLVQTALDWQTHPGFATAAKAQEVVDMDRAFRRAAVDGVPRARPQDLPYGPETLQAVTAAKEFLDLPPSPQIQDPDGESQRALFHCAFGTAVQQQYSPPPPTAGMGGLPVTDGLPAMGGLPVVGGLPAIGGLPALGGLPIVGGLPPIGGLPATGGLPTTDDTGFGSSENMEAPANWLGGLPFRPAHAFGTAEEGDGEDGEGGQGGADGDGAATDGNDEGVDE